MADVQVRADGSVRVAGRLQDGTSLAYDLRPESGLIGRALPGGEKPQFVKGWLPESHEFLLCHVNGFRVEYERVGVAARALLVLDPQDHEPDAEH